jgi:hypothetical protein
LFSQSLSQKVVLILIFVALATSASVPLFAPKLFEAQGWVTYGAAAFALLGWLTREFFALRAIRKQHTVTVLLQSRMSTAFNDRYKAMIKVYPILPNITNVAEGDWNDGGKMEAMEAVKYFLNYYEFVAIGVRTGDLDEEYLYNSLAVIVPNLCSMCAAYIDHSRKTRGKGVYEHLIWLRDRWAKWDKLALSN